MKKAVFIFLLLLTFQFCKAQEIMDVLPDSSGHEMFSDFIGIRLWAGDYSIHTVNQNLYFRYISANTGYTMHHGFDVRGLNNSPNIGTGVEENLGKHLLIHFADISIGYAQTMWNWNIGAGIGYFVALDKKTNLRLRASASLFYENFSFGLGSYYDTTLMGFLVNGNNIGTSIRNLKYSNNMLASSLNISLMYRTNSFDYFAGVSLNYVLTYQEKINFYSTKIATNEAIFDQSNNRVYGNLLNLGNYTFQVGIMRELGL